MKISNKKLDMIRWVFLIPITLLLLISFVNLEVDSESMLLKIFSQKIVSQIIDNSVLVFMPLIIALCGFYIAPKYKFISVVVLMCISFIPYLLSFDMDNSIRGVSNFSQINYINFINPLTISILILLFIVYKLEKRSASKLLK